jgi:hypothetical protein
MLDAKPWWQSKTVWASICSVLFSLLAAAGISIKTPPDDIAQAIITIVPVVLTVIAGIGAAFGRARATTRITGSRAEARRLSARLAARAPAETSPGVFRAPPT